MQDNPEGSELDPANDVSKHCKKNSPSVLSCIDKRTKEGCDRGGEVGTVHSRRDRKRPVPLRKPKESGRRECCDISPPGRIVGMPSGRRGVLLQFWRASLPVRYRRESRRVPNISQDFGWKTPGTWRGGRRAN